ncbi:MAG: ABC transporter permease [Myxococcaceae bacterium]
MRNAWLIAGRELGAYLKTRTGYVIAAMVLVIDGLLFNAFALGGGSKLSAEVLTQFFYFLSGTTMVASVFISMRVLAEERQSGTLALLYSSPVRDWEIVLGKYLAAFVFLSLLTLATVYLPALILVHGKVSMGHIAVGYVGLLLLGSASIAIGTFASSLAPNQLLAAVIGGVLLVAMLLFWLVARVADPPLSDVFSALALHSQHFQPFQSGIIHLRDVIYYALVTYVALFAATRTLEARRWR